MNSQHLSDEAVAAFADGVLRGHARERATRHTSECVECASAVREQREAVLALRAAPVPSLPTGLMDRLKGLPDITPITTLPTVVRPDGSTMLSTTAGAAGAAASEARMTMMPLAAFAPAPRAAHRSWPFVTAAAVALTGALTTASVVASRPEGREQTTPVRIVNQPLLAPGNSGFGTPVRMLRPGRR